MKTRTLRGLLLIAALLPVIFIQSCSNNATDVQQVQQDVYSDARVPGQYVVSFKSEYIQPLLEKELTFQTRDEKKNYAEQYRNTTIQQINSFLTDAGIATQKVFYYYTSAVTGFAATLTPAEVTALQGNPEIEQVDADFYVSIPPYTVVSIDQGTPRSQIVPCGITNAGGFTDGSTKTTFIWLIDSGVDTDHPDLNVNTTSPYATYYTGGSIEDCLGHGTHVAGICAAKDNGLGVVGVSAGAMVVPVRVFDCTGTAATSTIIMALDHVGTYNMPGDACNMSLGGYWGSNCAGNYTGRTAMLNIGSEGTFITVAAGNDNANAKNYAPACVSGTNIFTVAAMDCSKVFASYSNRGIPPIDFIATGSDVYSTYLDGGYATLSGTSMAAPHVAGICHARAAAPLTSGYVVKGGKSYPIATR